VVEQVEKWIQISSCTTKQESPIRVRYDQVNAMLLNEFLKEHRSVQELKKEVVRLVQQ